MAYMNKWKTIIMLSFILLIFFIEYYNCFINNKETFNKKRNGLLFLYGECFRKGSQNDRTIDDEETYNTQKKASLSHVEFFEFVNKNYDTNMNILIKTRESKYQNDHKSWYDGYYLTYLLYNNEGSIQYTSEFVNYKHSIDLVNNQINNTLHNIDKELFNTYDFVLFTRNDIFLKPEFSYLFNPLWYKIMFFSVNSFDGRINPTMIYFPKKYFYILQDYITIDHDAKDVFKSKYGLTEDDFGYMTGGVFDSDSQKIWNPFYRMIGRPETGSDSRPF
jgi:hypothetical protein